jgi:hypothetical protein
MTSAQAVAAFRTGCLNFRLLTEVLDMVGDFGDFEGACECQQRRTGYYSGGDRGNYLQDVKAGYSGNLLV